MSKTTLILVAFLTIILTSCGFQQRKYTHGNRWFDSSHQNNQELNQIEKFPLLTAENDVNPIEPLIGVGSGPSAQLNLPSSNTSALDSIPRNKRAERKAKRVETNINQAQRSAAVSMIPPLFTAGTLLVFKQAPHFISLSSQLHLIQVLCIGVLAALFFVGRFTLKKAFQRGKELKDSIKKDKSNADHAKWQKEKRKARRWRFLSILMRIVIIGGFLYWIIAF